MGAIRITAPTVDSADCLMKEYLTLEGMHGRESEYNGREQRGNM